ncbi:3'-5' exonuclease [Gluconobacter vitians]|uniref:3'-5' exonuclease n=1 Tax=Gluconobacter vitians TaxID=2728102 RepID=UPI001D16FD25|nr:3'-5' exonuclease [Gluconobacter vitians]
MPRPMWKNVFVMNVVDGCIPSDLATGEQDDIKEERRLLYVAMTRAKDSLDIMIPQRFYVHGQHSQATGTSMLHVPVSSIGTCCPCFSPYFGRS